MNVKRLFNVAMSAAFLKKQDEAGFHCVEANDEKTRADARELYRSMSIKSEYFTEEAFADGGFYSSLEDDALSTLVVYHRNEAVSTLSLRGLRESSIAEKIFGLNLTKYQGLKDLSLEIFNIAVEPAYIDKTREAIYCLIAKTYIYAIQQGVSYFIATGDHETLKAVKKRVPIAKLSDSLSLERKEVPSEYAAGLTKEYRKEMAVYALSMNSIAAPATVAKQMKKEVAGIKGAVRKVKEQTSKRRKSDML